MLGYERRHTKCDKSVRVVPNVCRQRARLCVQLRASRKRLAVTHLRTRERRSVLFLRLRDEPRGLRALKQDRTFNALAHTNGTYNGLRAYKYFGNSASTLTRTQAIKPYSGAHKRLSNGSFQRARTQAINPTPTNRYLECPGYPVVQLVIQPHPRHQLRRVQIQPFPAAVGGFVRRGIYRVPADQVGGTPPD